jgi:hypothetical protein
MKTARFSVLAIITILLLLSATVSCGDDDDESDDDSGLDDDDTGDDDTDVDDDDDDNDDDDNDDDDNDDGLPQYLQQREYLLDWSSWGQFFDHADPYHIRRIGGFGLGNGRVFSMVACATPFNTLHNLQGVNYQRNLKFFSDKRFFLEQNGEPLVWERESAYRVRGTDIILIEQEVGDITLWSINVVPQGEGIDGTAAQDTYLLMFVVHNRGAAPASNLALRAETVFGATDGTYLREQFFNTTELTQPMRKMVAGFVPAGAKSEKAKSLTLTLGDLAPGAEVVSEFLLAFDMPEDPQPIFDSVAAMDPDDLLTATYNYWLDFTDRAAKVTTSNERLNDLVEGMSYTVQVQTTDRGAVTQMSEYTGTWLRDIMGSARFYPLIGRTDELKAILDYYWLGSLERGGVGNSITLDMEFTPGQPQPDWENLGVMSGRTAAESPSYLIMHYKEYLNATGDWAPLEERYGMLRHALIHQNIREDCLLPFSGDETFRIAMAASFGQWVYDEYADTHLSANSSFLFVVAAEFLQEVAEHFGYDDHADEYSELAADFRACTEERYWMEDGGYYTPIIDIDTLEPDGRPFEDVNTKPLWIGYLQADDPRAKENVVNMWAKIGHDDGSLYTDIDPMYNLLKRLLDFEDGVITGMNYGYSLDNLARIDHPMAEKGFLLFERFFHESGNVSEGQIVDDYGRFMYLFEPFGIVSDLTARFRSWEGPIDIAAQIQYLFGLSLDARQGRITLEPHLPAGWEFATMENVMIGDTSFTIDVTDDGTTRTATVMDLTGALTVDARMSVAGGIAQVRVNGELVTPDIEEEWGRSRVSLPGLEADSSNPLVIEITRE